MASFSEFATSNQLSSYGNPRVLSKGRTDLEERCVKQLRYGLMARYGELVWYKQVVEL